MVFYNPLVSLRPIGLERQRVRSVSETAKPSPGCILGTGRFWGPGPTTTTAIRQPGFNMVWVYAELVFEGSSRRCREERQSREI